MLSEGMVRNRRNPIIKTLTFEPPPSLMRYNRGRSTLNVDIKIWGPCVLCVIMSRGVI